MRGEETKLYCLKRDGYRCQFPGCQNPGTSLAHRIAQTKTNIKKYGKSVIHHPKNMVTVCHDLRHNSWFNIGNKPVQADELAGRIVAEGLENWGDLL